MAILILGLLFFDLYLRLTQSTYLLGTSDQAWLLVYEVPMMFSLIQVYFQGAERRYRILHPAAKRVHFRTPHVTLAKEKHAHLRTTFAHEGDLRALAKHLIEEWEWRRELKIRAQEPLMLRAKGFFKLPSPGNFAAYLTGFVAILVGIVIAPFQRNDFCRPGAVSSRYMGLNRSAMALYRAAIRRLRTTRRSHTRWSKADL
ncbi:hypothetical protein ACIGCM_06275 [Pseudomonas sp. NPDC078700]|uniref:hypothetical protein n=1 Tax=Pseudomonas sp. NPDC078700 TaxID=3364424 RepID=UPI0037CC56A0